MDSPRQGLRVRKLAGEPGTGVHHPDHVTGEPALYPLRGVVFTDDKGRTTDQAPTAIRVPTDYVQREPWIEMINPTPVLRNAGPASNPTAKLHTFIHVDEIVLHMLDGDYRYRVVGQPDKYTADGEPGAEAGDPGAEVRWFYDADLIKE